VSWLDDKSDLSLIDQRVNELQSFTEALADGVVEKKELEAQLNRVVGAMTAVEPELGDELHAKVTELLVELTAYSIMRTLQELQAERARVAFGK
jgi:predicted transcriptional regulator